MNLKQREEAAREIAASVKEAIDRIRSDHSAGDQIVRRGGGSGKPKDSPKS